MRYAPVLTVDTRNRRWKTVGIIIQNSHGVVLINVDEDDSVVRNNREFTSLVKSYNEQFEEGELTFYERADGESASHIGRLPASDAEFIAKFRDRLAVGRSNIMAIGDVFEIDSENVIEHMDRLLAELKRQNGNGLPTQQVPRR